jgi:hypothetical protein
MAGKIILSPLNDEQHNAQSAAVVETTSSGVVVAILTIVPPTTIRGILKPSAIWTLASTKRLPPLITRIRPRASKKQFSAIGMIHSSFKRSGYRSRICTCNLLSIVFLTTYYSMRTQEYKMIPIIIG